MRRLKTKITLLWGERGRKRGAGQQLWSPATSARRGEDCSGERLRGEEDMCMRARDASKRQAAGACRYLPRRPSLSSPPAPALAPATTAGDHSRRTAPPSLPLSLSTAPPPPSRVLAAGNYGRRPAPLSFPLSPPSLPLPAHSPLATTAVVRLPSLFLFLHCRQASTARPTRARHRRPRPPSGFYLTSSLSTTGIF